MKLIFFPLVHTLSKEALIDVLELIKPSYALVEKHPDLKGGGSRLYEMLGEETSFLMRYQKEYKIKEIIPIDVSTKEMRMHKNLLLLCVALFLGIFQLMMFLFIQSIRVLLTKKHRIKLYKFSLPSLSKAAQGSPLLDKITGINRDNRMAENIKAFSGEHKDEQETAIVMVGAGHLDGICKQLLPKGKEFNFWRWREDINRLLK